MDARDWRGPLQRARRLGGRVRRRLVTPPPAPRPAATTELPADVRLLLNSPLFDHQWYAAQVGKPRLRRVIAAKQYLENDGVPQAHPHPLFDPQYFVDLLPRELADELAQTDPFVFYLSRRLWEQPTHPSFDTAGYVRRHPGALKRPNGPIGHYVTTGAPQGLRPNDWLVADDDGRFPDLVAWIRERHAEWHQRQVRIRPWRWQFDPAGAEELRARLATNVSRGDAPTVSVIVDAGVAEEDFRATLRGLYAQSAAVQAHVIDRGVIEGLEEILATELPGATRLRAAPGAFVDAVADAVAQSTGDYVAFLTAGDVWEPGRMELLLALAEESDGGVVADVMANPLEDGKVRYSTDLPDAHTDGPHLLSRDARLILARLLVRRETLDAVGGIDRAIRAWWEYDVVVRLALRATIASVPVVGLQRLRTAYHRLRPVDRPALDPDDVPAWADVVRNRRFIDWADLATRRQDAGTVSVIIPTYDDWAMTAAAVDSVMAADEVDGVRLQCIVWDNGSSATVATQLDALAARYPELVLIHSPVNHGFALGNNLALRHAEGATVVFLNNDTTVAADWLRLLLDRLDDPDVLGVQPLLVYPTGAVQSAGVVFPATGGLPYNLLGGFPVEDARNVGALRFSALTGAALVMRYADAVALEGFDPIFHNGMEDVDLCQRLAARRSGSFRVVPDARVIHHESRSPGRYLRSGINRLVYLDRWRGVDEPRDDVAAWASCGYRILGRRAIPGGREPDRLRAIAQPTLVRAARLEVSEGSPRLRWAIKIAAPAGPEAEVWGDTHFARALARALRELDQEVVIDHRGEFARTTSSHDDVALALRGLARYYPVSEQVNIGWVISHPEAVGHQEAASFDRMLAASTSWAAERSQRWGIRIDALLQATDPELFNPARARPDTGHPVLFVGASRNIDRPIVRHSVEAGLPLSVYGHGWSGLIPKRFIKGEHFPNAELGAAYRAAGVVLNDHWEDMREAGFLSNRLFDAVASGARVVTDDVAGLRSVFGPSVQVYRTPEDLTRLSSLPDPASVFGDDDAILEEAARIHREHSFAARARQLLDIAIEERKRRGFDA